MAKNNELTEMDIDLAPALMRKGSNAAIVAHVIATRQIAAHADKNDPESLMRCLEQYLAMCMEQNIKLSNMACYAACGVDRNDISNWANGRTRKNDPRYKEFALLVKSICGQYRENSMQEGTLNPVVGIWHQKQYDGMMDNPMPETEPDKGLEMKEDPDEIAARYRDIIDATEESED